MTVRLDIINSMLATTGTSALSTEDTQHPDYIDASLTLDNVLAEFGSFPMWFNSYVRTLAANVSGEIVPPSDAMTCEPTDSSKNYFIKGNRLFNSDDFTFNIGADTECRIVTNVPLDEMPPAAVQYVRAQARLDFFVDQDGSEKKATLLARKAQDAMVRMDQINLRQHDINFFNGNAAANFYTRRSPNSTRGRITRW